MLRGRRAKLWMQSAGTLGLRRRRQQRWRLVDTQGSLASGREELQGIAALQPTGRDHRQDALHIGSARPAACAQALAPPQYRLTQGPFGRIVGRLDAFGVHESPQGLLHGEDLGAGARRLGVRAVLPLAKTLSDLRADSYPLVTDPASFHRAVTHAEPQMEHLIGQGLQPAPQLLRWSAAIDESLPVPIQMRPAHLAVWGRQPGIGAIAIAAGNALIACTQKGHGALGVAMRADQEDRQVSRD